jgi:hypothetical protein
MEDARTCASCGAAMYGPFEPALDLSTTMHDQEPEQELTVTVCAWVCPRCGLALWYAQERDLDRLETLAGSEEDLAPKPAASYERRMQVLHMLRRVRRM